MIDWQPAVADPGGALPAPISEAEPRRMPRAVAELPLLLGLAVLIAFVFKSLVAQAFYIPSGSMFPQLEIGDRVVVSKLSYRLHEARRGDIVVFDCPPRAACPAPEGRPNPVVRVVRGVLEGIGLRQPSTEEYIKRVVGLPGETVEGRGGRVFIDGSELVEPYLPSGTPTSDFGPVQVPEGELWVMGDNRNQSADSRSFGTIRKSTVVGRAIVRAWPFTRVAFL